VKDIKEDMGLLNYVEASEVPKWLMMQLDHNVPVSAQQINSLLATMYVCGVVDLCVVHLEQYVHLVIYVPPK